MAQRGPKIATVSFKKYEALGEANYKLQADFDELSKLYSERSEELDKCKEQVKVVLDANRSFSKAAYEAAEVAATSRHLEASLRARLETAEAECAKLVKQVKISTHTDNHQAEEPSTDPSCSGAMKEIVETLGGLRDLPFNIGSAILALALSANDQGLHVAARYLHLEKKRQNR